MGSKGGGDAGGLEGSAVSDVMMGSGPSSPPLLPPARTVLVDVAVGNRLLGTLPTGTNEAEISVCTVGSLGFGSEAEEVIAAPAVFEEAVSELEREEVSEER